MNINFEPGRCTPGELKALSVFCIAVAADKEANPAAYDPEWLPSGLTSSLRHEYLDPLKREGDTAAAAAHAAVDQEEVDALLADTKQEDESSAAVDPDIRVDEHGVPFDADMCGASTDAPFYASGATAGQWKKRRGVDKATYDAWYAAQLSAMPAQSTNGAAPVDAAAAFGGGGEAPQDVTPSTPGELMVWISEHQTAGKLQADDLANAYAELRLAPDAIFESGSNPPEAAAAAIHNVHQYLLACIDDHE